MDGRERKKFYVTVWHACQISKLQHEPVTGSGPRGSDIPSVGRCCRTQATLTTPTPESWMVCIHHSWRNKWRKRKTERERERDSELAPASFKQHASQKVTKNFSHSVFLHMNSCISERTHTHSHTHTPTDSRVTLSLSSSLQQIKCLTAFIHTFKISWDCCNVIQNFVST